MKIHRRGILIFVLLGLSATASLALAVTVYLRRLPDPNTADRSGLFRWLVECDLKDESPELQLSLMRRVERELVAGVDFRDVMPMLDADQRQRLQENADLLARCWFSQAADNYFAAPKNKRTAVLGQQLDALHRLGIMDQLSALDRWSDGNHSAADDRNAGPAPPVGISKTDPAAGNHAIEALAAQAARVQRWIAEAAPQIRLRLSEYFAAVRDRLLADYIRNLGGLGDLLPRG